MSRYNKNDFLPIEETDITRILSGEITLTDLVKEMEEKASKLGKRSFKRTALKENILKMLENDAERKKQFLSVLKSNSKTGGVVKEKTTEEQRMLEYPNVSVFDDADDYSKRKERLFYRILAKDKAKSRQKLSKEMLERKYNKLENYIITERNKDLDPIDREVFGFDRETVLSMVEEYPNLITSSIQEKIKPCLEKLDAKYSKRKANFIFKGYANIANTSLARLEIQLELLEQFGLLKSFASKPKNFMFAPNSMYALIQFALSNKQIRESDEVYLGNMSANEIFLSGERLRIRGTTLEGLRKMYPYPKSERVQMRGNTVNTLKNRDLSAKGDD